MDQVVKIKKLQPMKRHRRKQFLPTLIQSCLMVVMLALFLSIPHWLPTMLSSIRRFSLVSLLNVGGIIFRPKCLFIVIIIFLLGESKLSKSPPTPDDIYEEYVARRRSIQRLSCTGEVKLVESVKKEEIGKGESLREESVKSPSVEETNEEDEQVVEKERQKSGGVEEEEEEVLVEMKKECEELCEEEETGLPVEELNRRVEDFIAKFNMQRRLEARTLVCYG